jgi:hypothetical protein
VAGTVNGRAVRPLGSFTVTPKSRCRWSTTFWFRSGPPASRGPTMRESGRLITTAVRPHASPPAPDLPTASKDQSDTTSTDDRINFQPLTGSPAG